MNKLYPYFLSLIMSLLAFPSLHAEAGGVCTINQGSTGPHYGCDPSDITSLIIGEGVGLVDLSAFTDLRNVTVTVLSGSHPGFLATTLINKNTNIALDVVDGLVVTDASVRIIENSEVIQVFDDNGDFNLLSGQLLNLGLCLDADLGIDLLSGLLSIDLTDLDVLACTFVEVVNDILPVELVDWNAVSTSGGVTLDWQTATETDNDYYRLSHSTDGKVYSELTRLSGRGTTGRPASYQYRHAVPAPGTNYYRLEQVDYDGTVYVLGIRSAEWAAEAEAKLSSSPNPVTAGTALRLNGPTFAGGEAATLLDGAGRLIGRYVITAEGRLQLPSELLSGIYFLRYRDQATRISVTR